MSSDRLLFRSQSDEESVVGTPISKSPSLASIREGSTRKESYSSLASYCTGGAEDGSRERKHFGESFHFPILLAPIRSYFTEHRFVPSQTGDPPAVTEETR
uniref:Putative enoyl-coa hydratase/enoyl-coa isomerase/3-hydroxyacyl-coa dehydrogenase n=1 Tax=Anopheles triannulatus TaxID=58253 RepID=A0A2M4AUE2_9DIPT